MTFDEFINKPRILRNEIDNLLLEVERLQSICERTTAIISPMHVQHSTGENRHETALIRYIDARRELDEIVGEYSEAAKAAENWLYDNLDIDDASILTYRYCSNLTYDEIADRLPYVSSYIKNKACKAIKKAKVIYINQQPERG